MLGAVSKDATSSNDQCIEESAQNSQALDVLQALLAQVTERISIFDCDYRFLGVTPAVAKAWQRPATQFTGMHLGDLVGKDSFYNELKHFGDQALAGHCVEHVFWHEPPEQKTSHLQRRLLEYRFTPWTQQCGEIAGFTIRVTDLTESRKAAQDLADTQQRITDFANATSDWFWEMDSDLRFTWISQRVEEFFDLDRRALYGRRRLVSARNNEEKQAWLTHRQSIANRQSFRDFDYRVPTASGERWARVSGVPIFTHDGKFSGYRGTASDITKLKSIELAIKEEHNLLRSLIDNIPDLIYAKDRNARFIVSNQAQSQFVAERCDHKYCQQNSFLSGTTDFDFFPPEQAQVFHKADMQVIKEGKSVLDEQRCFSNKSQEALWLSTTKVPLKDTTGNIIGLVGIGRNISAHKNMENKLRSSEARFKDFAETAADLFWELDANLNITFVSERYQELTGQAPQSILGSHYQTAIVPILENASDQLRIQNLMDRRESFHDLEIILNRELNGNRHLLLSGKPCFNTEEVFIGYRGAGRDVTKFRKLEKLLSYQASHDELTRLPNRREFVRRLEQTLAISTKRGNKSVLGYIDLDQFKIVNDTVGHFAGDQLLIQLTSLLAGQLRKGDTLARLGGDEFGLLLENCTLKQAISITNRAIRQFDAFRFSWEGKVFSIGASVGLVSIDANSASSTELLSRADVACFAAKDRGRGRVHVYCPEDHELAKRHGELLLANGIRESIKNNRLILHAQAIARMPKNDHSDLVVEHYEILLRLQDENSSLIPPGSFIPAAERYGLMGEIDQWVIRNAFEQLQRIDPSVSVTINLSGQSLSDEKLAEFVQSQLGKYNITGSRICFEITETAIIRNLDQAQKFIKTMKELGCTFALDDFGSGLSSFSYLKHFAVDYLKIDGSFVRDIVNNPTDQIIVRSINQIGKSLGIKTIAEFVENTEIIHELKKIGIDMVQGYGVGRPIPFEEHFRCEPV